MVDNYMVLRKEVEDKYVSVVWSHKIQEKQSDIYEERYKKIEIINISAAALTSVGVFAVIFNDGIIVKIITAVLSLVTTFIGLYFNSFDVKSLAKANKSTANKLIRVRDELRILLLDIKMKTSSPEVLFDIFKNIAEKVDEIYSEAPNTSKKAKELARKALDIDGDNTVSDEERNTIIPENLREQDD